MRLTRSWSTHMPMLIKCVQRTNGPILEMGTGVYSTPLLHWLALEDNRKLVTLEAREEYIGFAKKYEDGQHEVVLVKNWDKIDLTRPWSVALVDHEADRRVIDAVRLKNSTDYIVLHDTEDRQYGYDVLWPHFKYIYHWRYEKPWTSVVSNLRQL